MSCYSASDEKTRVLFKEKCFERVDDDSLKHEMYKAIGSAVIKCADFFTVYVQPICTEEDELVYAISQYDTEEVILVHDDDYPDLAIPEWCSNDLIPIGYRKALALTETLHADNIQKYNIQEYEDEKNYAPNLMPLHAYYKSIGRPIPVGDIIDIYLQKFKDTKFYQGLIMLLKYVGIFALGGIVLSFFYDGNVRGYFFGGALMGLFYFLLALFTNAATNEE